jgi:hypothetical protein
VTPICRERLARFGDDLEHVQAALQTRNEIHVMVFADRDIGIRRRRTGRGRDRMHQNATVGGSLSTSRP